MSIVDELVADLGFGYRDCLRVIATAPARYFVFQIDKRSGGKRTIAHPARELKAIQRYIMDAKLSKFPVHSAATAYKKNMNIKENSLAHVHSDFILKMDFQNFFHSIKPVDWRSFAKNQNTIVISKVDMEVYTKILFWGQIKNFVEPVCLSIGAPTSPILSNILMYKFDEQAAQIAKNFNIEYTRYADDITISSSDARSLLNAEKAIRNLVGVTKSPRLNFNEEKRYFFTKGGRRSVTGLILTPDRKVSVGRDRKRKISSLIHHLSLDDLSYGDMALLKGLLGFCIAVEAPFVERLRIKYGNKLIDRALKYRIPPKDIQIERM